MRDTRLCAPPAAPVRHVPRARAAPPGEPLRPDAAHGGPRHCRLCRRRRRARARRHKRAPRQHGPPGAELGHAGHTETSVMLALGPVDMSRARKGYTEPPSATPRQRGRTARLAARSFLSVAPGGVWGDPRGATRADGERLLAEFADGVASECVRLFGGRRRPMRARRR
ncbi:MAG: hypothetical protein EB832_04450 [Thaumarchaeota archaeon S14]|nr:MAG: hypothetical protein EB832_04450 [Thaumarchaeota archaeon S14]